MVFNQNKQDEEWDKEVAPLRTEVPDQRSTMARRIKERLKQKRTERKAARKQEAKRTQLGRKVVFVFFCLKLLFLSKLFNF